MPDLTFVFLLYIFARGVRAPRRPRDELEEDTRLLIMLFNYPFRLEKSTRNGLGGGLIACLWRFIEWEQMKGAVLDTFLRIFYNVLCENKEKEMTFQPDRYQRGIMKVISNNADYQLFYKSTPTLPSGYRGVIDIHPSNPSSDTVKG